jgi:hypothetical protein
MQENPNLQAHLLAESFSMDLRMAKKLLNNPNRFLVHEFCSEPLEFYSDPLQWWGFKVGEGEYARYPKLEIILTCREKVLPWIWA